MHTHTHTHTHTHIHTQHTHIHTQEGGGGGNPFDMKNLMESVKKAQGLVQQETQRVQQELAE